MLRKLRTSIWRMNIIYLAQLVVFVNFPCKHVDLNFLKNTNSLIFLRPACLSSQCPRCLRVCHTRIIALCIIHRVGGRCIVNYRSAAPGPRLRPCPIYKEPCFRRAKTVGTDTRFVSRRKKGVADV